LTEVFDIPSEVVHSVVNGKAPMSAYSPFMTPIHGKHVIGINGAFKLGLWVDVCFFGDNSWYLANRKELARWPNLKVSCAPWFSTRRGKDQEGVKFLPKSTQKTGVSMDSGKLVWGCHSGAAALNLAVLMGCKRIYLIGFDMKISRDGRSHWHYEYKTACKRPPFKRHLAIYPTMGEAIKKLGVEVVNLCPGSGIRVFPYGRPPWKTNTESC
jgi:hypothetical protein